MKQKIAIIASELFQIGVVVFLLVLLGHALSPASASFAVGRNGVAVLLVVSGFLAVITRV